MHLHTLEFPHAANRAIAPVLRPAPRPFRARPSWKIIVSPESARAGIGRRRFLAASAGVLAAYTSAARAGRHDARIAVVGAGIAGLNATYLLANAGFSVSLYEGSDHIGGRIQTNSGGVVPDIYTELGGEFIDSGHDDMRALAATFGFGLIDTRATSEDGLQVAYFAGGRLRSETEVIAAFQPLASIVDDDSSQLSDEITFDSHSPFDARLDRTPLRDYTSGGT